MAAKNQGYRNHNLRHLSALELAYAFDYDLCPDGVIEKYDMVDDEDEKDYRKFAAKKYAGTCLDCLGEYNDSYNKPYKAKGCKHTHCLSCWHTAAMEPGLLKRREEAYQPMKCPTCYENVWNVTLDTSKLV